VVPWSREVHHRTATTWCMGNMVSRLVHRGTRGKPMLSAVVSTCHIKVTVPMAEGGGGPNRFQNRGRGLGAQQMLPRGGFEIYHRPQVGATVPQHPSINIAGPVETLPFWHQIRMPIILAMRAPCDFQSLRHRWFRRQLQMMATGIK
jgi:hypothetical protein